MTSEQINIAIAQECGWHDCSIISKTACGLKQGVTSLNGRYEQIPDYCNDLTAMHEAMELMIRQQYKESNFWFFLREIIGFPEAESDWDEIYFYAAVNATARQRAEAFLRTIGKWEEAAK